MNVDILGDTSAYRYAYESDDEDQLNPLSSRPVQRKARVSIQGDSRPGERRETVIVASGKAGNVWAQGAQLGEQYATVVVDDITVGVIFLPSWTDAVIIVSETSETLPTWTMRPYAEAIISFYNPTRLLLLDTYPAPTYISPEPLETYRAPVRYLRTRGKTAPSPFLMPFLPPNLIQATCAAFVSLAALPTSRMESILLLLPSQHIPIPRGNDVSLPSHASEDIDSSMWSETTMRQVHGCLAELAGMRSPAPWQGGTLSLKESKVRQRGDIGEGGMYM